MDKKSESEWKEIEASSRRGCASVWPKIVQLRAELKTYEDVHGYFEAMRFEAQRHLVKMPTKEAEQNTLDIVKMGKIVAELTDDQRGKLIRTLEVCEELTKEEGR